MDTLNYVIKKYGLDINEESPIYLWDKNRYDFPELFKELNFVVGVEIGVLEGEYSEILCKSNPELKLYSIDAWLFYPMRKNARKQKDYDKIYKVATERLSRYPNCEIIRKWSADAVNDFADESLDFVFIDGDHEFRTVTNDIADWSKKVRKGGIVAGHDYGRSHDREFGNVKDVVIAWTYSKNISPWFVGESSKYKGNKDSPDYRENCWFWVKT